MPRMETIESRSGKVLRKPFPCVICALESVEDMPACSGHDQHPLIVRALACHCLVSDVLRPLSVFVAEIIDPHEPLNALRESPLSCFSVSLPHHANQSVTSSTLRFLFTLSCLTRQMPRHIHERSGIVRESPFRLSPVCPLSSSVHT
nr:hypothetical protein CFP56_46772 [Quercus suber]